MPNDQVLDSTETAELELENQDLDQDEPAVDDPANPPDNPEKEPETEEVVGVTFGDPDGQGGRAEPIEPETPLIQKLRRTLREKEREARHLRRELEAKQIPPSEIEELPPRPTISDEGIDFDDSVYAERLESWLGKKREIEQRKAKAKEAEEAEAKRFMDRVEVYKTEKAALKLPDYEEAEADLLGTLSQAQAAILLKASSKPALMVYALGKSPEKAQKLSEITDPIDFVIAVRDLEEKQMKVSTKKPTAPKPPEPERTVRPSGGGVGNNATLEQLEAEASRTGDRSKLIAWKLAQKHKT